MVVAQHQQQARSMGDMLAALNQQAKSDKGQARRKSERASSQFALAGHLAGSYNGNEEECEESKVAKYNHEEEEEEKLRRVPLLDGGHLAEAKQPAQRSRWRSCRWLDDVNWHEEAEREERVRRAPSKKSLMENLFSHSNLNQARGACVAKTRRKSSSSSGSQRDKFRRHQCTTEDELFICKDGDGEVEKVKQAPESLDLSQSPNKSSLVNRHSLKLLSLLSHDSSRMEFGPGLQVGDEPQLVEKCHYCNDGDCAAAMMEEAAIMTSCRFPATNGDCCRSIEQHNQQRQHQQQVAAAARRLASSSPILAATTNDNYDATTGDCSARSNKEPCEETTTTTTTTCNTAKLTTGGPLEPKRKKQHWQLASATATATRNGQVVLTKLPRAERARTQRQLEAGCLKHQHRRRHATSQRDLSVRRSSASPSRPTYNDDSELPAGHCMGSTNGSRHPPTGSHANLGLAHQPVAEVSNGLLLLSRRSFGCRYSSGGEQTPELERQQLAECDDLDLLGVAGAGRDGLDGHENHNNDDYDDQAEERHKLAKAHTDDRKAGASKNNARELSPSFGSESLASTKSGRGATTAATELESTTTEATCAGQANGRPDGQRQADNHQGRRDSPNVGQLPAEQQQQQQQQVAARRTVTNGIAPLACQLEETKDEASRGESASCLGSAQTQDEPNGCGQLAGGPNEIRWREASCNDHRQHHQDPSGQSPETNQTRPELNGEQMGSAEGGGGECVGASEAPRQMSDQNQDQKRAWWKQQQQQMSGAPDLNDKSVTTRLVDTCASSWRQATLMASPVLSNLAGGSHSGLYKVAQQQQQQQEQQHSQQLASGKRSSQTNQQYDSNSTGGNQYGTSNNGQEVRPEQACHNFERAKQREQQRQQQETCKQQPDSRLASTSQRRLSRPGRSPISLQRQTNARLARHRLKIQQQRQEQLASLALRERQQSSTSGRQQLVQIYNRQGQPAASVSMASAANVATSSLVRPLSSPPPQLSSTNQELGIEILPLDQEVATRRHQTRTNQSSSLLRDLFERLSGRRLQPDNQVHHHHNHHHHHQNNHHYHHHQQQQQASFSGSGVALVEFGQQSARVAPRDRHQQQANNSSVAIQLCDNNNYLNSRGGANHRTHSASQRHRTTNMHQLTSADLNAPTRTQRHQQSQMASKRNSADSAFDTTGSSSSLSSSSSSSSSSSDSSSSSSTLSLNKPFCKICHLSSTRNGSDKLISPCKCSGTMQYIHCGCLLKWLEISNRTNEKPISCELCAHEYTWHKRFNYRRMKLPKCSSKDIILHLVFVLALGGMLFCALAPLFNRSVKPTSPLMASSILMSDANSIMSSEPGQVYARSREISFGNSGEHHAHTLSTNKLHQDRLAGPNQPNTNAKPASLRPLSNGGGLSTSPLPASMGNGGRLASDEKFILICAAFFFISFFIAIYAQTKTRDTLYGLIVKFTNMNLTYYITEYDHGTTNTTTGTTAPTAPTTTTTSSATRNGISDHSDDCTSNARSHNHPAGQQNIDASQHPNGAMNHNQKGRASKHLHGQSHLLNNGRKASV